MIQVGNKISVLLSSDPETLLSQEFYYTANSNYDDQQKLHDDIDVRKLFSFFKFDL